MTVSSLPKGLTVARLAIAQARANSVGANAVNFATNRWGEHAEVTRILRAAVPAGSVGGEAFGDPAARDAMLEFFGLVTPKTIPGNLPLRATPFRTKTLRPTAPLPTQWVGEAAGKPIGALQFAKQDGLEPRKVVSLSVATKELLESDDQRAEVLIRNEMARSIASAVNAAFIDPANAGEADIKPAAVTYGLSAIGGGSPTNTPDEDFEELIASFTGDLERAYLLMPPLIGAKLSSAARPNIGARSGGEWAGIPVVTSTDVPTGVIALVDPDGIAIAEGTGEVRTSTQASIEMVDAASINSGTPVAAQLVSMWQANCVAIMTERVVNWQIVRPGSVAIITNANY